MRKGTILQVKGIGIPVQAPSKRNLDGYEIRWSSDPEVPADAPAHVLIGHDEVKRFLELAVDRRFVDSELLTLTPVDIPSDSNSMNRQESLKAGISADHWNVLRVALVISGNSALGPVMDELEWLGTREEYAQGNHMREALIHAQHRGIKSPAIIPHTDSGHLQRAAKFMMDFRSQYRPSLRASEHMARILEKTLAETDLAGIHPDRAKHYLSEIQRAVINFRDQRRQNLEDIGYEDAAVERYAPTEAHESPAANRRPSGPTLN